MPMKEKKSCERHGQVLASGSEGRVKLGEGVNVCGRQSRASHIQLKRSASRAMCMLGAALLIPDGSRTFLGNTERYAELMSDMRLGAHHQREMDGWMDGSWMDGCFVAHQFVGFRQGLLASKKQKGARRSSVRRRR